MILKNNLYHISQKDSDRETVIYTVELQPEHFIHKSHFPGKPIMPGVCILQTGMELLADHLQLDLRLTKVKNVKFLSILSPETTSCVQFIFQRIDLLPEESTVKAQVKVADESQTFTQMSFSCEYDAQ